MALTQTRVDPATPVPEPELGSLYRLGALVLLTSSLLSGAGRLGDGLFVIGMGLTVACLIIRKRVDVFVVWPTAFLALLLISGVMVDSLPNSQTLAALRARLPEFLFNEGRVFLAYIPLLLPAVCRPDDRSLTHLVRLYRWVAAIGLFMATVGQVPPFRSLFIADRTNHLFGLSSSHHVSGFLFGTAALVMLTSQRGNRRANLWLGIGGLGVVVATGSRTTILGIAVAGLCALLIRSSSNLTGRSLRNFRAIAVAGLILLLPLQSTLGVPIFEPEVISSGIDNLSGADPALGKGTYDARTANSLKRFALWGESTDLVLSSPILGIGAFRFNDRFTEQAGLPGFIAPVTEARRDHGVTTAHNSYLHVLVELGVVGLALLLAIWLGLAVRLSRQRRSPRADELAKADATSAMLVLAFAMGTGLTSASLFTPGLCVPVLLYVGSVALRKDLPAPSSVPTTAEAGA